MTDEVTMESLLGLSPEDIDEVTALVDEMIHTPLPQLKQNLQQQQALLRQSIYVGYRFGLHIAANKVLRNRGVQTAIENMANELDPYRP